ncbi:MAG: chemotaxis protein CheD [Acidobacteria bacterium]|nr:chemotaxis protein CheD [Acidobacteriota bacterium]
MGLIVVGISDFRCSADPEATIVTYALGSCIGVGAYDPANGVGGLLHFLLPDSRQDPDRAVAQPASYADTGIPLLLRGMERLGADRRRIRVRLAGGAQILKDDGAQLAVGKRNYMAARKLLWQMGVMVEMEAVGGTVSRNLGLTVGIGEFWVEMRGGASANEAPGGQLMESPIRKVPVAGAR